MVVHLLTPPLFVSTIVLITLCAHVDTSTIQQRMEQRCREYAESVFEIVPDPILLEGAAPKKRDTCRVSTQPTIVGGELANPLEFPHMALIGYGDRPTQWRCGGSLISEQWVMSAAHCTATPDHFLAKYVLLGDLDVTSTEDEDNYNSSPKIFKIITRVNHQGYKRTPVYNDIALYKLNATVQFSPYIRPICLHGGLSPKNNTVIAAGWGATIYNGSASSHLRKVGLDVLSNDICNSKYPLSENSVKKLLTTGVNGSTQVCAWADGKDTCQGDSGGPIQQTLNDPYCMYTIIGVTSVGNKCGAHLPSIYTRVQHYLPWIESHVWPESYISQT